MKIILLLFHVLLVCFYVNGQPFEKVSPSTSFTGIDWAYPVFGDMDADGDCDIILTSGNGQFFYPNTGGVFDSPVVYSELRSMVTHPGSVCLGDVNRDGLLDFVTRPNTVNDNVYIFINKDPGFENIGSGQPIPHSDGANYLGDIDSDGDLDLLTSGSTVVGFQGTVNRNIGLQFYPRPFITPVYTTYANWVNLDSDTDLEVIQSAATVEYQYILRGNYILKRDGDHLNVSKTLAVEGFLYNTAFADYDNDGDLDMLSGQNTIRLFKNEDGNFIFSGVSFLGKGTMYFGDINNDGLYDVILGGTIIYLNQGGDVFTQIDTSPMNANEGYSSIGDIDNDGDLDIVNLDGVFRNNVAVVNAKPSAPQGLAATVTGTSVTVSWNASEDDHTDSKALTYNLDVRDANGQIIVPGHSQESGRRQIYTLGNAYQNLSFNLKCLQQGTYYWKVQAIDASYSGSEFAQGTFVIENPAPVAPTGLAAKLVSDDNQIVVTWTDQSDSEDGFIVFRKETDTGIYASYDTLAANATSYTDGYSTVASTSYTYKIVAYNCAYPFEIYAETSITTYPAPLIPTNWIDLGNAEGRMVLLGDYDNDGDLDMLLSYAQLSAGTVHTKLYDFNGTGYVESGISFAGDFSHATWTDFDNDGYIDLYLDNNKLYRNQNAQSFSEQTTTGLPTNIIWEAGVSWGDYDNDGDEDMLSQSSNGIQIHDNDGKGHFTKNASISIAPAYYLKSRNSWADFDKDGDLDILASVAPSCNSFIVILENKLNNTFAPIELPALQSTINQFNRNSGDMRWGDFNNDGYPDILVAGKTSCPSEINNPIGSARIYRNTGLKRFVLHAELMQQVYDVRADWGDFDNDGDLDVYMYGNPYQYEPYSRIYRNINNVFQDLYLLYLPYSRERGSASKGDIDGDGDLDFVILGEIDGLNPKIIAYRNNYSEGWPRPNTQPAAPVNLTSEITEESIILSWDKADDEETPQNGLAYSVYIIDKATDQDIVSNYSLAGGQRKLVDMRGLTFNSSIEIKNPGLGSFKWGVQTIDSGLRGSSFTVEEIITDVEESTNDIVTLFPNPVKQYLTVSIPEFKGGYYTITITNSMGKEVLQNILGQASTTFNLQSLVPGVYFASIQRNGFHKGTYKLIKDR